MKSHKLLICMLSTTLVFPSYSVSTIHAESTKDASDNPTIEAPSTEQSHVSKSSDEKQEDTKKEDDKTKSSAQKSKAKMSKPTAPSWLPSWLDTFNHPLDVIHPTRQHSTHFWDNWLTLDPATDSITKDVNTTENDPNLSQSTPSTAHSDVDPTTNETTTKEPPSSHDASTSESTSEPSRDNSHLSEGDQAVANELDNITDKIQSNQPSDKDTSSETPDSKHDEMSSNEAPTTEDHHTEGKTTENNDTSTTSDHVDDALIDAYGKEKKSTPDTKTNEENAQKR